MRRIEMPIVPEMCIVKVIRVPEGEAPLKIREAWVGMRLLAFSFERVPDAVGVLTEESKKTGPSWVVPTDVAVAALEEAGKQEEATWWRNTVPEDSALVFKMDECEYVGIER
jgi:hypothetical protein